jgi:hypothetical protein
MDLRVAPQGAKIRQVAAGFMEPAGASGVRRRRRPNWEIYMTRNIGWLAIVGIFSFVAAAEAQTLALSPATTAFDGTNPFVSSTPATCKRPMWE